MKRQMTSARIEQEIGELGDLPRDELIERWRSLYRTAPPKGISRSLLIRAIAYRLQAKRYGGLRPATRQHLRKMADRDTIGEEPKVQTPVTIAPGIRLVREWNGTTHVVEAMNGGFIWNRERYGSLSAVARAITGARWSGPRFFGLSSGDAP